ncbi:GNAT family N-acetyltransferase [Pseudolysinimonas sp.]|uniref:GNAT family N-acetyltransferase n=1 Tax=Pseudolysinimonas sp. TaxID=2680009 RepID=UPI003F80A346
MIVTTERLVLESISPALAERIVAGAPLPTDAAWHPGYPFADELVPLRGHARVAEPDPIFTMYQVRTRDDGLAIGGLGFFGPPEDGRVELGYGLVAAARGRGYATEALRAAVGLAARHGARSVEADTEEANAASQNVLRKAGFRETHRDGGLVFFRLELPEDPSAQD